MMNRSYYLSLLCVLWCVTTAEAQLEGTPGAFARMGFGARGMGMGNAMTAVSTPDIAGYYNPAAIAFQTTRTAMLSYGALSLDRSFNTLNYTQAIGPNAGVSLSVINAGVKNIDGRDGDGFQTGMLTTSENQFALSFGLRPSKRFAIGITPKIYYTRLYTDVTTSSIGMDFGMMILLSEKFTVGLAIRDVMSKYKWDTSTLYGQQGNTTIDKFPTLNIIGVSYEIGEKMGVVSAEIESSNKSTTTIRMGGEFNVIDEFSVRAGLDHWDLDNAKAAAPTFGFTVRTAIGSMKPAIHYAYVIEPYNYFAMHIISLSTGF
jgi:opacity protein-like surface antigen